LKFDVCSFCGILLQFVLEKEENEMLGKISVNPIRDLSSLHEGWPMFVYFLSLSTLSLYCVLEKWEIQKEFPFYKMF